MKRFKENYIQLIPKIVNFYEVLRILFFLTHLYVLSFLIVLGHIFDRSKNYK